jgi:hypothetical protein
MLSEQENGKGLWYPDEEICRRRKNLPEWVNQQRKITRKVRSENQAFYFTLAMLKVPFRVTKSVKGLDSDSRMGEERQLKAWFKRYKGTKERKLSVEQRQEKRKAVAIARKAKKEKRKDPIRKAA